MFQYGSVLKDREFMKKVMLVAIPMMLQQLITNSVNLLDNLMVGRLGPLAISGVALSNKYFMIIMASVFGVSAAATIFMAQFYGAENKEKMKQGFRYNLFSCFTVTMVFVGLGLLFPIPIISFFTKEPELIEMTMVYFPLAAITFIPQSISAAMSSSMRSMGETKHPLFASVLSMLSNAFFNYCFIFGAFGFPAMGVLGAAIGTLIARLIELTYLLINYSIVDWPYKSKLTELFKIPKQLIITITTKALPLTVNEVIWSLGIVTLFKFYATRGTIAIASMTIASTTVELFFILFSGMAVATNVLVAHPLGSFNLELARKHAYQLRQFSVWLAVIFGILIFLASFITPHFYNISREIFDNATNLIRVQACFFWIYVYNTEIFFIIRAGGDVKSTLMMDAVFIWLVNIPIVYLLATLTNVDIFLLYICGQCTDIIKMFVCTHYFNKGKWIKNLVS